MMWNWLVSALAAGATPVLYDGSPLHPGPGILWDMAAEEAVTVFGTSPRYLAALEKTGYRPRDHHALAVLRTVLATGSPLAPEQYDFVAGAIGADVQLASISGGTDIVSCFALGNPLLAVYRGELQCRSLGLAVEVFDEDGNAVVGEKGELVCTKPFPSMPLGFWNDRGGEKYHAAYFARYPGVWCHGDWCELTERGTMIVYGRSDATLNPGGVRIGTAEIYAQTEKVPEIEESVAIGQLWPPDQPTDTRVVLFVKLREGLELDAALEERIRLQIADHTTRRHVPAKIMQVPDIPRTKNNKVVELAVKAVVHGMPVPNTDALANPEALELFQDLPELQT
jgi:acetoacetyl-CoA synthetase